MTDNTIKSTDVNAPKEKAVKKAPAKKAAAPKVKAEEKAEDVKVESGKLVVIFESGSSYTSNGVRFTRQNPVQEVPVADAAALLELDNFRLANDFEIEEYFNSKED